MTSEKTGTYYWIETLTSSDGTVLHRGLCGAPDETTTVIPVPETPEQPGTPEQPSMPSVLAQTGADAWLPFGAGAGILALTGGLTLLAAHRRRGLTPVAESEEATRTDLLDQE